MKRTDNIPSRFWEPQEERTDGELSQEWSEFQAWVEENNGIPEDPELPFN